MAKAKKRRGPKAAKQGPGSTAKTAAKRKAAPRAVARPTKTKKKATKAAKRTPVARRTTRKVAPRKVTARAAVTDTSVTLPFTAYAGEDLARLRIQVTTMGDLLLTAADRDPSKLALVFPEATYTYAELAAAAIRRARGLIALGVQPRDHVGILMPTCPEFVEVFFGILLAGGVAVPINARYKSAELGYVAENGDLVTIVTTDAIAEQVDFVERLNGTFPDLARQKDARALKLKAAPKLRNIVLFGATDKPGFVRATDFDTAAEGVSELRVHEARLGVRVRDVGLMLYTSGTTANPKGCLITHEAQVRNSIALGRHRYRLTHRDKLWSPLPMFHIASVLPMLSIFDVGGTYLTMGYFDPGVALKMLEDYDVTATYPSFVTIMQGLVYHPDFKKRDLSKVRLMNSNFAMQPPGVGEPIMKAMPAALQVGSFGMTEAAGTVCTGAADEPEALRITRLGKPLPGLKVRIVDPETGHDVPAGLRGEVFVHGYSLFEGYYRDPVKTAEALDAGGWFHTGDIGSLDDHGTIMFHGRIKDMLKVGGENVAAAEIEAMLQRHPAVKLAQVVGIPDAKYVEIPAAFIELKPGEQVTEAALIAFARKEIASFKAPRHVRFVTEWPMSSSKVQKFRLKTALVAELGLD